MLGLRPTGAIRLGIVGVCCCSGLWLLLGCQPSAPPVDLPAPPPTAPPPALAPATPTEEKPGPSENAAPPAAQDETPQATPSNPASEPTATAAPAAEKKDASGDSPPPAAAAPAEKAETPQKTSPVANKREGTAERVLLLTPGGPLVIDLWITVHGGGGDDAMKKLAAEAWRTLDEDGDGKVSWTDAVQHPRILSGEYGNLVPESADQRKQVVQMYDSDRDGQVDENELPRFFTRGVGGGRTFSLRSSNEFRTSNRSRSPTRLLIDADRDGSITAAESSQALARLLQRDNDDDEVVQLAEIKNALLADPAAEAMPLSNRRRTTEPDTAIWLTNPGIDFSRRWGQVQFLLQELYSYGEAIRAADWPLTPGLFRHLDQDRDDQLKRPELAALQQVAPHLELEVVFDRPDTQESSPQITVLKLAEDWPDSPPTVRALGTRLSLQLADVEIEFFVNQDAALTNAVQVARGQLQALDRDRNGYLEDSEFPEQMPGMDATFAGLDRDGDGKLYEAELVAYLQQRTQVLRSQVRARAADQEDALFAALDTDGDGRLNHREMRETSQRLQSFDRNADAVVQSHEIPGAMIVGLVRGNVQQDNQLFAAPATVRAEQTKTPRWFRGMDANADGEISRREFLGNAELFGRLDANQDGYVTVEEVTSNDLIGIGSPPRAK